MTNSKQRQAPSQETQDEALKIARATQKTGQTKEQTKLIAQGIQKGIEQYKKQQKSKARERDKLRKKQAKDNNTSAVKTEEASTAPQIEYKQHWLPWVLLVASWGVFAFYLLG
ncbi:DUF2956 domain-containing protein [Photobacterium swingsii]|uniref:DUF2956 domain-containing protein n=1 Tax=Photobacterium swingsii TaxID=680026 RepID=A0A0J8VCX5_9GAMM|nr:DUF2956 domain-containing protein [Photobacterium swingsii]KMV31328.1 membrane protein [Photobacterium swingsii]PSW24019.1 DUF2956 domain-containing protein [Photobacterium swingsii]